MRGRLWKSTFSEICEFLAERSPFRGSAVAIASACRADLTDFGTGRGESGPRSLRRIVMNLVQTIRDQLQPQTLAKLSALLEVSPEGLASAVEAGAPAMLAGLRGL